jgi:integrase
MRLISIFAVQRKKKKIYHAEYEYNDKVHRVSLKSSTKDEAIKKWNDILNTFNKENEKLKYEENLFSISVEKGFDEYLNFRKRNVQHSTFYREKNNIIQIKNYFLKNQIISLKEINETIFTKYYNFIDSHNLKPKTINNYLSNMSSIVKYFKEKKYISPHVTFNLSKYWKKKKKVKVQIINKNEARIIVEEFKKIDNIEKKVYLLIPFFTGLRFSEVRGINRKNIDLKNRFITICEKWTKATDFPESILKSTAGYRRVPIVDEFFPILKEYLKEIKEDYIFKSMTHNKVDLFFIKIKNKFNISMTYHMARHFFASLLIDSKALSIKQIQVILGHDDIQTTINTYGHLIQDWNISNFDNIKF